MAKEIQQYIFNVLKNEFSKNGCGLNNGISYDIVPTLNSPMYIPIFKKILISQDNNSEYYAQFAYQLAHELVHAYVDMAHQPECPIAWVEEILAANMSLLLLSSLDNGFFNTMPTYFFDYLNQTITTMLPCAVEYAKKWLNENHPKFIKASTFVYKGNSPLARYLYDHRDKFNIWTVLQIYKNFNNNKFSSATYSYPCQIFDEMKKGNPNSPDINYFISLLDWRA